MKVYVHGNCQAPAIAKLIKEACPDWEIKSFEVFGNHIIEKIDEYYDAVRSSELIISQPVHERYRDRDDLSLGWVRSNSKSNAVIVTFPSVHFEGQLIGCRSLETPAYGMGYHDILLVHFVNIGLPENEIEQILSSNDLFSEQFIESEIRISIEEMKRREASDSIDISISPFLERYARETQLFHAINHPCRPALVYVANKILARLGCRGVIPIAGLECLPFPHIPCPPSVSNFFRSSGNAFPGWAIDRLDDYHLPQEIISPAQYRLRAISQLADFGKHNLEEQLSLPQSRTFLRRLSIASPGVPGIARWQNLPNRSTPAVIEDGHIAIPPLQNASRMTNGLSDQNILEKDKTTLADRNLVIQFESLGGSGHGCEFGLFQRHFGAEPLGLLRWADLDYRFLVAALEAEFEGVGDIENTVVFQPDNGSDEWWTRDYRYWMAMRTFVKAAEVTHDRMVQTACKRLKFLRSKLIADLRSGEKIFVYKNMWRNLEEHEIKRLFNAVRRYGNCNLLYIRTESDDGKCGVVECREPGLFIGYTDHFAFSPSNERLGLPVAQFLELCARTKQLVDSQRAMADEALALRRTTSSVACLIMGLRAPEVLAAASEVYSRLGWDIFVHLDKKANLTEYRTRMAEAANRVHFVEDSISVFWGGISMVTAELKLVETARKFRHYDKFVFVSDDSFPIRSDKELLEAVSIDRPDMISLFKVDESNPIYKRYSGFYCYDHVATNPRGYGERVIDEKMVESVQKCDNLRKLGKKEICLYWGFAYWILSDSTIGTILSILHEDRHLWESFEYSAQPDEMLFHSVIGNFCADKEIEAGPMFMDFSKGTGPLLYKARNEVGTFDTKSAYFIRKVANTADFESFFFQQGKLIAESDSERLEVSMENEAEMSSENRNVREQLIESIWYGKDPFRDFPKNLYQTDVQGWQSEHPYLREAIHAVRPKIVLEIGVWKGGSTITMAKTIRDMSLDAAVISVDTWLGSWDHWLHQDWLDHLGLVHGSSQMMKKFMQNIISENLQGIVVPLPLDSLNASVVISHRNIKIDVLHIDAGHDYEAVMNDLRVWWPLLNRGGILLGDDYTHDGAWPGVRKAFDEFFGEKGMLPLEHHGRKCRVIKSE